jgi:hypothetical protein
MAHNANMEFKNVNSNGENVLASNQTMSQFSQFENCEN